MLMCDECGMWRHVYATRRLLESVKQLLEVALMVSPFLVVHHYKKPIYHINFTRWCMSELCFAMNQLRPCITQQTTQTSVYTTHKTCHLSGMGKQLILVQWIMSTALIWEVKDIHVSLATQKSRAVSLLI